MSEELKTERLRTCPKCRSQNVRWYEIAMALIRNTWMSANGDVSGLLTAIKPTMAMLAAVAKRLYPDNKEDQAAIVAQWSREEQGKEFGVHTKGGPA